MTADTLIPYIWAATGLIMIVVIVVLIFWASRDTQFDESIKDQIFSPGDDDRYD